ncbi:hypothetical protein AX17_005853 [Amanita inopinata Kibby_2008]|nr:hypothetical protein AX17_005853 [Amanita inopinata Kibby_2008]
MPHADASLVPTSIASKPEFWLHVHSQLQSLLDGQRHWISNLSNASSLIFNSLQAFPAYFGDDTSKAVNWCGFYINTQYFPLPRLQGVPSSNDHSLGERLLLGPFCGKPACQFINVDQHKARGVCADAYLQRKTLVVPNVDLYPAHIACDGETKSEIVCPLLLTKGDTVHALGVLDLDCLAIGGFDDDDKVGLERIASLLVHACDW